MKGTADYVKDECLVLLDRAFYGKSLTFFGEDGNGKYGQCVYPITCRITCYDLEFEAFSDDACEIIAVFRIFLDNYNSEVTGHAITDMNLQINIEQLLKEQEIAKDTLTNAKLSLQGKDYISFNVDVQQLLAW